MGIAALRTGLSNVFCAHIRTEFPAFNQQTRNILKKRQAQLVALGPARSTVSEQRNYLQSIVEAYQSAKIGCLKEDFRSGDNAAPTTALERRLASKKKRNLRDSLKFAGGVRQFQNITADRDEWSDSAASAFFGIPTCVNIYTWINNRYQQTKPCMIPGLVPYPLIESLFEEQTANWMTITERFVASIEQDFVSTARYCLERACRNKLVLASLKGLVSAEIHGKLKDLETQCFFQIQTERKSLQLIACEEQFVNEFREARTMRFISALAKLENDSFLGNSAPLFSGLNTGFRFGAFPEYRQSSDIAPTNSTQSTTSGLFGNTSPSSPQTTKASTKSENTSASKPESGQKDFRTLVEFAKNNKDKLKEVLTNDRQIVYEIHDILKAYYATSVQHYTDMVCKNKLDQAFMEDTMNVFSKEFLDKLPDTEISRIAAENPADRKTRRELQEDIERLEMAISQSEAILSEPLILREERRGY